MASGLIQGEPISTNCFDIVSQTKSLFFSICPTKFLLKTLHQGGDEMTLSHLTVAEVNGGIDGLLLGLHFKDMINDAPKLSQILDNYYLDLGNTKRFCEILK